jgi:flavin-dependent dehydrogenase
VDLGCHVDILTVLPANSDPASAAAAGDDGARVEVGYSPVDKFGEIRNENEGGFGGKNEGGFLRAKILVGADGINSVVRRTLAWQDRLLPTGERAPPHFTTYMHMLCVTSFRFMYSRR